MRAEEQEEIQMICKVCGREVRSENANFCEYCGASLREDRAGAEQPGNQNGYGEGYGAASNQEYGRRQTREGSKPAVEKEEPVSFKNWILTFLIQLIPFVGSLVYMVMLFVWSFGSNTNRSKRNWARATLIMMLLSLVLLILMFGSVFSEIFDAVMTQSLNALAVWIKL